MTRVSFHHEASKDTKSHEGKRVARERAPFLVFVNLGVLRGFVVKAESKRSKSSRVK